MLKYFNLLFISNKVYVATGSKILCEITISSNVRIRSNTVVVIYVNSNAVTTRSLRKNN